MDPNLQKIWESRRDNGIRSIDEVIGQAKHYLSYTHRHEAKAARKEFKAFLRDIKTSQTETNARVH